ncbi:MAG: R3H domain-containing nucleic acid-binding protein [Candidatus Nealsonbacteria bacterium]|nr:R3H domain-containing nucleic acid-binding protein [Candidatus Nealsonbacteria bacterium]
MTHQETQKIKEEIYEFFKQTGLELEVEVGDISDSTIPVVLKTEEPQFLIGERGQTLIETQRLLKAILRRKVILTSPFYIDIDVNDYKKKKIEYLKEMARTAADEVILTKEEKELPSMSSYDRRIIHTTLASRTDIATESTGQEPERKIVIKMPLKKEF